MKNEELDRFIAAALARSQAEVPDDVRNKARMRMAYMASRPRPVSWKRIALWAPLLAAALLLVAVSLSLHVPPRLQEKTISQIRTEFTLPDQNIKIIWVQRDDFNWPGSKG
jgi:hypothetical protein